MKKKRKIISTRHVHRYLRFSIFFCGCKQSNLSTFFNCKVTKKYWYTQHLLHNPPKRINLSQSTHSKTMPLPRRDVACYVSINLKNKKSRKAKRSRTSRTTSLNRSHTDNPEKRIAPDSLDYPPQKQPKVLPVPYSLLLAYYSLPKTYHKYRINIL